MQFLILQLSYQEKSNFLFLQKLKLDKTTTKTFHHNIIIMILFIAMNIAATFIHVL